MAISDPAMRNDNNNVNIGTWMVNDGIISNEQHLLALSEQKKTGKDLGRILVELNFIKERNFIDFHAWKLNIPFIEIKRYPINIEVVKLLPESLARRFKVLLLENNADYILLAMADPDDLMAQDEVSRVLKKTIRVAIVIKLDLLVVIEQAYRRASEIGMLAGKLDAELSKNYVDLDALLVSDEVADAPVVKLLQSLFEEMD